MSKQGLENWYVARAGLGTLNEAARDGRTWKSFRNSLRAAINEGVRYSATLGSTDEQAPMMRDLRRVHDLLYVADRIRKDAVRNRTSVPTDLMSFAESLLGRASKKRSPSHEKYLATARVHWHLLLKRGGIGAIRRSDVTRQLQDLAGREFDVTEVASLVAQQVDISLARLLALIDDTAAAYPTAAPQLVS